MGRHPGFGVVSPGFGYWDGLFGVAVFCTNLDKANEIISAEPNILLVNSWDGVKHVGWAELAKPNVYRATTRAPAG